MKQNSKGLKGVALLFMLLAVLASCSEGQEKEVITISAAASLKTSLQEINQNYMQDYPNQAVTFNFGSTGALRKQIEQGAPIDVFLSASSHDYEELKNSAIVHNGKVLFTNELVMVTKGSKVRTIQEVLQSEESIAIGNPAIVPAGEYAKQALTSFGAWNTLQGRFVYGKDVTHVLTLLEQGVAQVAIVYASEIVDDEYRVIHEFGEGDHQEIEYYSSVVKTSDNEEGALLFQQYLLTEKSLNVFQKYGFTIDIHQ
ncbi:molybdate ABC transporter substrate-binding protein [Bacillus spongiae]